MSFNQSQFYVKLLLCDAAVASCGFMKKGFERH